MLKAFIVDDEPLAREELSYLLRRTKLVEIAGEAESLEEAIEKVEKQKPDILFLDIRLEKETGLDIAQEISKKQNAPAIVFATAYDEYALKAFELNAVDYILKPFDENRIQQTIEKINRMKGKDSSPSSELAGKPAEKLAITVDERIVILSVKNIISIHTIDGKTLIITEKQTYQVHDPLVTLERKLAYSPITRVHRAFLANLDAVMEIEPWFNSTYNLIMKNGDKIPVSRTYTKELKQRMGF